MESYDALVHRVFLWKSLKINSLGIVLLYQALTDRAEVCVRDVLEMINFTNYSTWPFLLIMLKNTLFYFLAYLKQLKKLGVRVP